MYFAPGGEQGAKTVASIVCKDSCMYCLTHLPACVNCQQIHEAVVSINSQSKQHNIVIMTCLNTGH